jgi:hypothetical protein
LANGKIFFAKHSAKSRVKPQQPLKIANPQQRRTLLREK